MITNADKTVSRAIKISVSEPVFFFRIQSHHTTNPVLSDKVYRYLMYLISYKNMCTHLLISESQVLVPGKQYRYPFTFEQVY